MDSDVGCGRLWIIQPDLGDEIDKLTQEESKMAKKDLFKRAAGVLGMEEKEEETQQQPKSKGQEKAKEQTEVKTETPASVDPKEHDSKEQPKEEKKEADSATTSADQKSTESESKEEPKVEGGKSDGDEPKVEEAPKRGRKKGSVPIKDRVIVMVEREPMVSLLDSFTSLSRSATARAVMVACQSFLETADKNITEAELVESLKSKLAS